MSGRSASSPASTEVEIALTQVVQKVLTPDGLVVEELRLVPAGKRRVLRVLIDRDPYAGEAGSDAGSSSSQDDAPDQPIAGLRPW